MKPDTSQPKIVFCFFGINRSLKYTGRSICQNVFSTAPQHAHVRKAAHFFDIKRIDNPRSGEFTEIDNDLGCVRFDKLIYSKPHGIEENSIFKRLIAYGDAWGDNGKSLNNLVHQLVSLKTVTNLALEDDPDIVVFLRPDLNYHDSLTGALKSAIKIASRGECALMLPDWQRWGGENDRFSIAIGKEAILGYGHRLDISEKYCVERSAPLHSERLVAFATKSLRIIRLNSRASRVRAGGEQFLEDFSLNSEFVIQRRLLARHSMPKLILSVAWQANKLSHRVIYGDRCAGISIPPGGSQMPKR